MSHQKYLNEMQIEEIAALQRFTYLSKTGECSTIGISAEDAALNLLGIDVDWEPFGECDLLGKTVLPMFGKRAKLVLNEDQLEHLFKEVPHLENTTVAHELGHLILHVDHGKTKQMDLGLELVNQIEVPTPANYDPRRLPSSDHEWREWQAHSFMRHFLAPRELVNLRVRDSKISCWSDVVDLAGEFRVTRTVMRIQLEKLRILPQGQFHRYQPWETT